jgi:putative cofactor-binding repeat protein
LISARGERVLPYREFHLGYKRTVLAPGEIVHSVTVPRRWQGYCQTIRKVGTRKAQAISKVALASLALVRGGVVEDVRFGAASLRETPARLEAVERVVQGRRLTSEVIAEARAALAGEVKPIDDIRSTAKYRAAVAGNLVEEFLRGL